MVEAVAPEHVAVLHGLNAVVGTLQHAEGELALMVGLHAPGGVFHLIAIDLERHALHGDARAVVHHVAGELHALAHLNHLARDDVIARGGAEGDVDGVQLHDAHHADVVVGPLLIDVGQVGEAEEAALVGSVAHLLVAHGDEHLLARYAGAVEEAQVALHGAELLAEALHGLGLAVTGALAVGHAAHLIYILVYGRGLLVEVLPLGDLGGYGCGSPVAVVLVLAPHLVVVHRLVIDVGPGEQRRGGIGLHVERQRVDVAQVLIVEGWCHVRHGLSAVEVPAAAQQGHGLLLVGDVHVGIGRQRCPVVCRVVGSAAGCDGSAGAIVHVNGGAAAVGAVLVVVLKDTCAHAPSAEHADAAAGLHGAVEAAVLYGHGIGAAVVGVANEATGMAAAAVDRGRHVYHLDDDRRWGIHEAHQA